MKEKDFKSLSVDEQKDKINKLITSWYEQDSDNRCAIIVLSNRKDKENTGDILFHMLGPRTLIAASLNSALDNSEAFKNITTYCLMGPLGGLISMLSKSEKEEE